MSSSAGSLVLAFFCAARRIDFCLSIASSSARIDFCAADEERHDHVREHDDVPQRQQRNPQRAAGGVGPSDRRLSFRKNMRSPVPLTPISAAFW